MKKLLLLFIIVLFSASVVGKPLHTSIHYDEYPEFTYNMIHYSVYNAGNEDYNDLQATIFMPGLNEIFKSPEFDLDEKEHFSGTFYYELPDNARGDYSIHYTVSNIDVKSKKYRFFTVI